MQFFNKIDVDIMHTKSWISFIFVRKINLFLGFNLCWLFDLFWHVSFIIFEV